MPIGNYPTDPVVNSTLHLSRSWDVWMNQLQNFVDFGNPPSSTTDVVASEGIIKTNSVMRVQSSTAGNTNVSDISAGYDGEKFRVEGLSDVKTVTINASSTVILKSSPSFVAGEEDVIEFGYNKPKAAWIEIGNNN